MENEYEQNIWDYVGILKRRKLALIVPFAIVFALGFYVIGLLPEIYQSRGTILVERQEIPEAWVNSTVATYADERIQIINQQVLTTENLSRIISKYGLYEDSEWSNTLEGKIQRIRSNFNLDTVNARSSGGRRNEATIAFSISFENESPEIAQSVASDIVSLYLQENVNKRTESASDTARFLTAEAEKIRLELAGLEQNISVFKEENNGSLPEQLELNTQLLERSEQEILAAERQIDSLNERATYVRATLAQISPYTEETSTPAAAVGSESSVEDRIEALQVRYLELSAVYASNHPDVQRAKRELEALAGSTGVSESASILEVELSRVNAELLESRQRYSDEHPDVLRLEREVANLEGRLSDLPSAAPVTSSRGTRTRNPAYIELEGELSASEAEARGLRRQIESLTPKLAIYRSRIIDTPEVERQYRALVRDHENLRDKYSEIRSRQSSARLAASLEEEGKGERFSLLEPPFLPVQPVRPDKRKLLILTLAVSMLAGMGSVVTLEALNDVLRGSKSVALITGAMPIGVIPTIRTAADKRRARSRKLKSLFLIIITVAAVLFVIDEFVTPVDDLFQYGYETLLGKVSSLTGMVEATPGPENQLAE